MYKLNGFIWVLLFLGSCRCDENKASVVVDAEMHHYLFKPTTTWIYRNTHTFAWDTVIITRLDRYLTPIDYSRTCINREETFYMEYISSLRRTGQHMFFVYQGGIKLDGDNIFPHAGSEIFNRSMTIGGGTLSTKYDTFYTYLLVQGKEYHDVKRMELLYPPKDYGGKNFLYWAPDFGLIRRDVIDSSGEKYSWDLVDYHIINYGP